MFPRGHTQALAGCPAPIDKMLRYKKKMILWGPMHVGYCMMTFIIRNGLGALKQGLPAYLQHVSSLTNSWGLEAGEEAKVNS